MNQSSLNKINPAAAVIPFPIAYPNVRFITFSYERERILEISSKKETKFTSFHTKMLLSIARIIKFCIMKKLLQSCMSKKRGKYETNLSCPGDYCECEIIIAELLCNEKAPL